MFFVFCFGVCVFLKLLLIDKRNGNKTVSFGRIFEVVHAMVSGSIMNEW